MCRFVPHRAPKRLEGLLLAVTPCGGATRAAEALWAASRTSAAGRGRTSDRRGRSPRVPALERAASVVAEEKPRADARLDLHVSPESVAVWELGGSNDVAKRHRGLDVGCIGEDDRCPRPRREWAGVPALSRLFLILCCGDSRVPAGASGGILRDQRGIARCLTGRRLESGRRLVVRRLRAGIGSHANLVLKRLLGSSREVSRRRSCRTTNATACPWAAAAVTRTPVCANCAPD